MKILLANYRYFVSGGPERYMFNVARALTERNHEVIPFSVRYSRNEPTPFEKYFVEPIGNREQVLFREQNLSPRTLIRSLSRLIYARDVENAVKRIIVETEPQVAYILHYLRKLSPSLLVGIKRLGLPIVVRLSDYAMLCPQAHCLRNDASCELCVRGNLLPSIWHKCIQGNCAVSALNAIATWYHRSRHFFDLIDVFVVTNQFMYRMMVAAGFPEERLRYIPTFVDTDVFRFTPHALKQNYIVYSGRLEMIKGVHIILDALSLLCKYRPEISLNLKIAGAGEGVYRALLINKVKTLGLENRVEMLGELSAESLSELVGHAILSIVPSLWYENLPNALLESYACGTPVVASNIGSLAESVSEGETGYLFRAGDPERLADRLIKCAENPDRLVKMSGTVRRVAESKYSAHRHVDELSALFVGLMDKSRRIGSSTH